MNTIIIGRNTYRLNKLLGEGGYAFVYLAENISSPEVGSGSFQRVAVKKVIAQTPQAVADTRKEIKIMNMCRSVKHIPTLIEYSEKNSGRGAITFYMVMELCIGGNIAQIMIDFPESRFSESTIWALFSAMLKAVAPLYFHHPTPIVHRDIKVENMLLCTKRKVRNLREVTPRVADIAVRLCDFGSCTTKHIYDGQSLKRDSHLRAQVESNLSKTTTLFYRAPEMCDLYSGFPITEKTDIWALGILLYKLAFFCTPYDNEVSNLAIRTGKFSYPKEHSNPRTRTYSESLYHLIEFMLIKDPRKRPDLKSVISECERLGVISGLLTEIVPSEETPTPIVHSQSASDSSPHDIFPGADHVIAKKHTPEHQTSKPPSSSSSARSSVDFFDQVALDQSAASSKPQDIWDFFDNPQSSVTVVKQTKPTISEQPSQLATKGDDGDQAEYSYSYPEEQDLPVASAKTQDNLTSLDEMLGLDSVPPTAPSTTTLAKKTIVSSDKGEKITPSSSSSIVGFDDLFGDLQCTASTTTTKAPCQVESQVEMKRVSVPQKVQKTTSKPTPTSSFDAIFGIATPKSQRVSHEKKKIESFDDIFGSSSSTPQKTKPNIPKKESEEKKDDIFDMFF
ncbi:hypothetical protein ADUPG1_008159 [Aduncisulcus paluster]|uniref:non-specific serine/threonine protein kinase n=1 Tax=Aduncisulcus paluster TaxID=2918883 RepID=A0ABQ5KQZ7_9EUKA|nr:hypothetical protein ADUPG1_008159 [Aduncisulcus paluster]